MDNKRQKDEKNEPETCAELKGSTWRKKKRAAVLGTRSSDALEVA